ncbi:MAG: ABC transporter substrate-binding protein [Mycobacterium sp.]|nr:ABC transporter substrate-binding protein [Mycobacterium sp.]
MDMLTRRILLMTTFAGTLLALGGLWPATASAQTPEQAAAFVEQTGKELTGVVNGGAATADKQAKLKEIVDRVVDVDSVARFCLGRFWRGATPEQQTQYLALFHQVLLKNITGKLGDYQGVTFVVGRTTPRDGGVSVATVVTRPGTAPANVEWVVNAATGGPRIVDVVAEGTSLRLTQRSDYASYLAHNGNSVSALLDAMKQQLAQPG